MTIFKTFLKILKSCRTPIILYTVILIAFGGINMQTSDESLNFVAAKPDVLIVSEDNEDGITTSLIAYMSANSNIIDVKADEESRADALFYRDVNYIIYIPKNWGKEFLEGKNPRIEIQSTKDYQASLAELMLNRYVEVANTYVAIYDDEKEIIEHIDETLKTETEVTLTTKLDTDNLTKMGFYYNFASYSIMAVCIFVICLILASFKNPNIAKRTIISSMNYKKFNRVLLLANALFALVVWFFYFLLSLVFLGDIVFSPHGLIFCLNSLIFMLCATSIALLIGNLVNNKEAINGIVNVVALGSSFLCGVFVPMKWLPTSILKFAHILPSYWYVSSNETLKTLETIDFTTLKPIFTNMLVLLGFTLVFIILTNIISRKKRKQS